MTEPTIPQDPPASWASRLKTVLFLAACFAVGAGLAKYALPLALKYRGGAVIDPHEIDRSTAPLPVLRGLDLTASRRFDPALLKSINANAVSLNVADVEARRIAASAGLEIIVSGDRNTPVTPANSGTITCVVRIKRAEDLPDAVLPTLRKSYSGKILLALPFDEVARVPNLHLVDYIGLYGQVPLNLKPDPDVASLRVGWQNHLDTAEAIARRFGCKIILLDLAFDPAVHPGAPFVDTHEPRPDLALATYEALLLETRGRETVAGVFLTWPPKLQPNHENELLDLLKKNWSK